MVFSSLAACATLLACAALHPAHAGDAAAGRYEPASCVANHDAWQQVAADASMSPARCAALCAVGDHALMGLSSGNSCMCADDHDVLTQTHAGCDAQCGGDAAATCGGEQAVSAYVAMDAGQQGAKTANLARTPSGPLTALLMRKGYLPAPGTWTYDHAYLIIVGLLVGVTIVFLCQQKHQAAKDVAQFEPVPSKAVDEVPSADAGVVPEDSASEQDEEEPVKPARDLEEGGVDPYLKLQAAVYGMY